MEERRNLDWIRDADVSRVNEILRDLVRLPSENPGGTEQAVVAYCKDFLEKLGYQVELQEVFPQRENLIARKTGAGMRRPMVFCGHMDVVPVSRETEGEWSYPPFGGEEHEGYIWGRGACDMKGGIAASLAAAELLIQQGIELPGDVMFALTVDEEGLMSGAKAMAQAGLLQEAGSIVVCDTTNLTMKTASKGRTWADVEFIGRSAHASIENAGINAIEKALGFIQRLKKHEMPYAEHPRAGRFFYGINMIQGGTEPAMVPDRCTITLDARLVPGQRPGEVWDCVQRLIDQMAEEDSEFQAVLRIVEEREPWEMSGESPLLTGVVSVGRELGMTISDGVEAGTTDATFLKREGTDLVILGPGRTEEIHCVNERVEIQELQKAVRLYAGLMVSRIPT